MRYDPREPSAGLRAARHIGDKRVSLLLQFSWKDRNNWRGHKMGDPRDELYKRMDDFVGTMKGEAGNPLIDEMDCTGHVASAHDAKVCKHCGTHIDSLRPDESNPADLEG